MFVLIGVVKLVGLKLGFWEIFKRFIVFCGKVGNCDCLMILLIDGVVFDIDIIFWYLCGVSLFYYVLFGFWWLWKIYVVFLFLVNDGFLIVVKL